MTHSIRQLRAGDEASYRAVRLEALTNHPEAFVASAEGFLQKTDAELTETLESLSVFAAETDTGSLGGIAAFYQAEGRKEQHRGWLIQVYVRPEHRGSGMAEALINTVVEFAQTRVIQLHLGVWSENEPALKLYKRLGFSIYGTEPRYLFVNGRYVDEHLMVRFLDNHPALPQRTSESDKDE
ncbi:GNAT family N-acetyltransferase [Devosia sp. MC532]|uniref:GNAT family N-acetyltransferase n=1 Tax=Devosia sp. MC532 TaxID=2799788 RepID=UPI0018F638C7|nr:GNAT family N-acetyltransferase [Devosia sp. MC532]